MKFFIEGPRNTGKTYMLDSMFHWLLGNVEMKHNFMRYKFDFGGMFKNITEHNLLPNDIGNFDWHVLSMGKDLALMDMLKKDVLKEKDYVFDRSFLSSAVYSTISNRITFECACKYIELIVENYSSVLQHSKMIFVYGKNPKQRDGKDAWDVLDKEYDKQIDTYKAVIKETQLKKHIDIIELENTFNGFTDTQNFYKILSEGKTWKILQ